MKWMPIESAPKQKKVLAGYRNSLGNWRTVTAIYYPENTLEIDEYAGDWEELDEYAPAGWYETSETQQHIYLTKEVPVRWMPVPAPPEDA